MRGSNRLKTCCFIGDCTQNSLFLFKKKSSYFNNIKLKIERAVVSLIENLSVTNFMSGMNIGFELCGAEIVLEKKEKYPGIILEGVLPYEAHSINWTEDQRNKYYSIMEKADREILLQYRYTDDCMRKRDMYMIHHSKYIIYFQEYIGNINSLIIFAKSIGRSIITIDSDMINKIII